MKQTTAYCILVLVSFAFVLVGHSIFLSFDAGAWRIASLPSSPDAVLDVVIHAVMIGLVAFLAAQLRYRLNFGVVSTFLVIATTGAMVMFVAYGALVGYLFTHGEYAFKTFAEAWGFYTGEALVRSWVIMHITVAVLASLAGLLIGRHLMNAGTPTSTAPRVLRAKVIEDGMYEDGMYD